MGAVAKGFMKGLRYLSSIFETEREPEMQIGGPTDVKHVAHIGWDGPTASAPSWMNQFKESEGGDPTNPEGGLPTPSESPTRHRTKKSKGSTDSTDSPKRRSANSGGGSDQAVKPSRKKKPKAASSSGGSNKATAKANKTAMGPVAETNLEGG